MEENTEQVLQNQSTNDENQPLLGLERIRYPKSVFFIIVNEFCERFNYYGLRSKFKAFQLYGEFCSD